VTASDPIKRPLRLPRRSADGPTAQVRNAVTTTLNNIIKRPDAPTSGMTRNADRCFKRLANFDQPIVNQDPKLNRAPRVGTTHEICASASATPEQDKEAGRISHAP